MQYARAHVASSFQSYTIVRFSCVLTTAEVEPAMAVFNNTCLTAEWTAGGAPRLTERSRGGV